MRTAVLVILATVFPVVLSAQPHCKKGIPCGNSCISASKVCRIDAGKSADTRVLRDSGDIAAAMAPAMTGGSTVWVASKRGKAYYRYGCKASLKLSAANRRYFAAEEEAQKAGYARSTAAGC